MFSVVTCHCSMSCFRFNCFSIRRYKNRRHQTKTSVTCDQKIPPDNFNFKKTWISVNKTNLEQLCQIERHHHSFCMPKQNRHYFSKLVQPYLSKEHQNNIYFLSSLIAKSLCSSIVYHRSIDVRTKFDFFQNLLDSVLDRFLRKYLWIVRRIVWE